MPVTPFHFGPGTLAKSLTPNLFSLRAFILCQVVIDCETAWNIYRGNVQLHTFFHTYLGSVLAMLISAIIAIALNVFLRIFRELERDPYLIKPFSLLSAATAIVFGGTSHVLLDSIMHSDMQPLAPFSKDSPTLGLVSLQALHLACLASFAAAAFIWMVGIAFKIIRKEARMRAENGGRGRN